MHPPPTVSLALSASHPSPSHIPHICASPFLRVPTFAAHVPHVLLACADYYILCASYMPVSPGATSDLLTLWSFVLCLRCIFQRVEGLTFDVVKAGVTDDNIFQAPGVIITHRTANAATDKKPMIEYTDEYIEAHSKMTGNKSTQRERAVSPSTIGGEKSYTYNSDLVHKGLERAVYKLLARNVSFIVGDCGFDNGIQALITQIVADALPHKRCPCIMSAVTMLPSILKMIAKKEVVLVITSNSAVWSSNGMFKMLTGLDETFSDTDNGYTFDINNPQQTVSVLGLQDVEGFGNPVASGDSVDLTLSQRQIPEIISARMKNLTAEGKAVGAILSECSELPAYSNKFREKFGVPVFDAMTAVSFVADSLKPNLAYNASAVADDGKPFKRETPSELAERMGWKEEPKEEL
eukprot:scaffold77319_cov63-Phaeocystis_antarctica.AAC.1